MTTTPPAAPRHRYDAGDVQLAWDAWGPESAPAVVLCHGYTGSVADMRLHVDHLLDHGYRVVIVEHRGHGYSGWGHPDSYTTTQLATDLIGFLAATQPGPVHLLGHSMGGRLAMEVVAQCPDLVRSLILMDTSAWSFRSTDPAVAAEMDAYFAALDPETGAQVTDAEDSPEVVLTRAAVDPAYLSWRASVQAQMDPVAVKRLGIELFHDHVPEVASRLAGSSLPTTVLVGSLDQPYAGLAAELAALFSDGDLVVFDGAHHSPQLTHLDVWRRAVVGHLRAAQN